MDGRNGQVLESENADIRLSMASTTKIMTALVVLKNKDLKEQVTVTPESVGIEGSSLYIKSGETYTVEELLYALMLRSANDCAEALAIYVGGGDRDTFIKMMNEEAKGMGLKDTAFANPSGLPQEGHYTTARELALIMKSAMEDADFRKIVATKQYKIKGNTVVNHNRLLSSCEGCVGGKTGYTMEAGRCLVSVTQRQGVPLICVTLGIRDDWNTHIGAYDRWFDRLTEYTLMEAYSFSTPLKTPYGYDVTVENSHRISVLMFREPEGVETVLSVPPFIYGNKEENAVAGTVILSLNDLILGESPLVLTEEISVPIKKDLFISRLFRFFRRLFLKNR